MKLEIAFALTLAGACHSATPPTVDINSSTSIPPGASTNLCVQNLGPKDMESKGLTSEQTGTQTVPEPEQFCPTADMEKCLSLAIRALAGDEDNHPDRAFAMSLAREACDRGYARACTRLGTWLETEDGSAPDLAEAFSVYSKGCCLGDMTSCFWAGVLLSRPHHYHFTEDWPQAFQLLTMACNGGKCSACGELAVLYREGRGCTRDAKRARSYQRLSKDLGCVE